MEPTFRCSTKAAISTLAAEFELPNNPDMQDWEHEVANPERLGEFLSAFETGQLSDDEAFCLMETVIQSFEDLEDAEKWRTFWPTIKARLRDNFQLHAYTIWYWANFDGALSESWTVSPSMRHIFRDRYSD